MCVIAVKPKDVDMPNEENLKRMWTTNKDGAGFMYTDNNKVRIEKGFMTFEELKSSLNMLSDRLKDSGKTLKDIPIIMHFRITTHGGTSRANTHPFPITGEEKYLKALDVRAPMGVAHNGIIRSVDDEKDVSDTMVYIRDVLYPLSKLSKTYVDKYKKLIETTIGYSKLAFLSGDGTINMIGDFKQSENKDGLYYSNLNHEPAKTYKYDYTNYYPKTKKELTKEDYAKKYIIKPAYRYIYSYAKYDETKAIFSLDPTDKLNDGSKNYLSYNIINPEEAGVPDDDNNQWFLYSTYIEEYVPEKDECGVKRGEDISSKFGDIFSNYKIYSTNNEKNYSSLELISMDIDSMITCSNYVSDLIKSVDLGNTPDITRRPYFIVKNNNFYYDKSNERVLYKLGDLYYVIKDADLEILATEKNRRLYLDAYWQLSAYNALNRASMTLWNVKVVE